MERPSRGPVEPGATGIFLSGGLDSVTVAMHAADMLPPTARGSRSALSIMFPEFDESGGTDDGRQRRLDSRTTSCRSGGVGPATVSS